MIGGARANNRFPCWLTPPVLLSHLYVFFGKNVYQIFAHFLIQLFAFWYWVTWAVCVFWRLIPCWLLRLQIFSPFWGLSFYFVYGFLCWAKSFSLIRSQLFICVFICTTLGGGLKKILQNFYPFCFAENSRNSQSSPAHFCSTEMAFLS